jgi:hypothetical protein
LAFNAEFFKSKIRGQKLIFVLSLKMVAERIPAIIFRAINQAGPQWVQVNIRSGRFSAQVISEAKSQMIRKSGLMEFWSPADINDVGGWET